MEGVYSSSNNSRVSKMKSLKDSVLPMDKHLILGRNRYNLDMDSSLIRYLRCGSPGSNAVSGDTFSSPDMSTAANKCQYGHSGGSGSGSFGGSRVVSPLSAVENIERLSTPVYCTPVKVEEEVMVMDGILVESLPGGRSTRSGSDSGGSSSSGKSLYKTEICRSWEESGNCRYGFKCQFAHGKEELRSTHVLIRNKPEANICKSYTSTGSCIYGSKCRFLHQPVTSAATKVSMATNHTASPAKLDHIYKIPTIATSTTIRDWSPYDDIIEIALASTQKASSREDIDECINNVLYGSTTRRRLPMFAEICPE